MINPTFPSYAAPILQGCTCGVEENPNASDALSADVAGPISNRQIATHSHCLLLEVFKDFKVCKYPGYFIFHQDGYEKPNAATRQSAH